MWACRCSGARKSGSARTDQETASDGGFFLRGLPGRTFQPPASPSLNRLPSSTVFSAAEHRRANIAITLIQRHTLFDLTRRTMMETQDTIVTPDGSNPTIRSVNVNRAVEWLVGGFKMFAKAPGPWLVAALALLIGSFILGKFWLLGGALSTAFGIVFTGAMMRACHSLENGQEFTAGLQQAATSTPLLILAAIGAALGFALLLVTGVFG